MGGHWVLCLYRILIRDSLRTAVFRGFQIDIYIFFKRGKPLLDLVGEWKGWRLVTEQDFSHRICVKSPMSN
jgi:hypothetical protein